MTDDPHPDRDRETVVKTLSDEYDEAFVRDAIEAIEDADAEPTVERVEAVLRDVEAEIDAAAAAAETLSGRSPNNGGESA